MLHHQDQFNFILSNNLRSKLLSEGKVLKEEKIKVSEEGVRKIEIYHSFYGECMGFSFWDK